jgi:hypothetical protein
VNTVVERPRQTVAGTLGGYSWIDFMIDFGPPVALGIIIGYAAGGLFGAIAGAFIGPILYFGCKLLI